MVFLWIFFHFVTFKKENFEDTKFIISIISKVRDRERKLAWKRILGTRYFVRDREIERFEIKRGILPRAPTNVQGTELRDRDREIFEIEGSRNRERFYCISRFQTLFRIFPFNISKVITQNGSIQKPNFDQNPNNLHFLIFLKTIVFIQLQPPNFSSWSYLETWEFEICSQICSWLNSSRY